MQLYILRHGQSTNNALTDQRDRVCDPPLTKLGERQAEILARHLDAGQEPSSPNSGSVGQDSQNRRVTRLYCSPMWRALQTARPIGLAIGLMPEVWIDIHERGGVFLDHGDGRGPLGYPGKTRQELQAEFPNYVLPKDITEQGWWNREFEGWAACHRRAITVAEELRQWAENDERIVIVSHVDFIDALIKALLNQLPDTNIFYSHYNAAISRIDFQGDGCLDVCYLNRVNHLPRGLTSGNPRRPFACPPPEPTL